MLVKTKTVSGQLHVNPSTIQRWVKFFNLPCRKNEHGHLLFSEQDIEQLMHIKKQLNNGLAMDEVNPVLEEKKESVETISMAEYEKKMDEMVSRLNEMERTLSQKADEVVSVRLYQHRSELDQLTKAITEVESRIETIENQLAALVPSSEETPKEEKKPRRNWLVSLFGT